MEENINSTPAATAPAKKTRVITPEQREAKNARDRARRAAKNRGSDMGKRENVAAKLAAEKTAKAAKRKEKSNTPKVAKPAKLAPKAGKRSLRKLSGKFSRPPRIEQNGIVRPPAPGPGEKATATYKIWKIADEISAANKNRADAKKDKSLAVPASCKQVKERAEREKISSFSVTQAYYQWRKFHGIRWRLRKDGTISKPMGPGYGKNNNQTKDALKEIAKLNKGRKAKVPAATSVATKSKPAPKKRPPLPGKGIVRKASNRKPATPPPAASETPAPAPEVEKQLTTAEAPASVATVPPVARVAWVPPAV